MECVSAVSWNRRFNYMFAIKAIFDGTNFKPIQPIPVKESYEVVITFIEPSRKDLITVDEPGKLPRATIKGLLKGKVQMSNDFNEPIADMQEYME